MTLRSIAYGSAQINFKLSWSTRRVLTISVDSEGVSVIAPRGEDPNEVDRRVKRRARWILRQQRAFAEFKPLTPPRKFIGGETHRYLGRQYRLKIEGVKAQERVRLHAGRIWVESIKPKEIAHTKLLVEQWFRMRAHEILRERYEAAAPLAKSLGIPLPSLRICAMTKRWGSHTPAGRILLNERLVSARRDCIDYVIAHELCHVVEPNHSPKFFRLLYRLMPDWPTRKELLERSTS